MMSSSITLLFEEVAARISLWPLIPVQHLLQQAVISYQIDDEMFDEIGMTDRICMLIVTRFVNFA
ncbi:hypothetical protein Syun_022854 [Stephania yunnanensis]|uniref:Uncharacterized protein n=1 Tax=Stephania yunnanensis TaxID=152371 RepID=A0AAP0HYY9_9MAGN